jgi:hypothetical protein
MRPLDSPRISNLLSSVGRPGSILRRPRKRAVDCEHTKRMASEISASKRRLSERGNGRHYEHDLFPRAMILEFSAVLWTRSQGASAPERG